MADILNRDHQYVQRYGETSRIIYEDVTLRLDAGEALLLRDGYPATLTQPLAKEIP